MSAPLSRELRARFHTRSLPVRKGDTVRVMAGSFLGQEERVARVNRRSYTVTLENVTVKTGEEKMTALPDPAEPAPHRTAQPRRPWPPSDSFRSVR
ncbi:50S ribosomal protein L24P, partial [mine drainage metagenome]